MRARRIDQPRVVDARRTGGAARKARQTPVLRPDHLATRRLLAPVVAEQKAGSPTDALPDPTPFPTIPPGSVTARDRAIAQLLRSVATLIET